MIVDVIIKDIVSEIIQPIDGSPGQFSDIWEDTVDDLWEDTLDDIWEDTVGG